MMDIQNIAALSSKLEALGFEHLGYQLIKKISFRLQNFWLVSKANHLTNDLNFHLFLQRNSVTNNYELLYYDAILKVSSEANEQVINGIDIGEIKTAMAKIDWKNAFDLTIGKNSLVNEKSDWRKEEDVELVIEKLEMLEKSENGKSIATSLKLEFWAGLPYQDLFGNIAPVKNKYEISQRFYCAAGQPGISVDEAYRFLQNRLLEKQISLRKKQPESQEAADDATDSQPSSGSGLLRKKRISGKRNSKKQHQ